MARPDHSLSVLAPLEDLDDTAALKHFKRGLEALIRDDFAHCIEHLRDGIALNKEIEPLNRDMSMLMERVTATMAEAEKAKAEASSAETAASAVRTDFSLYSTSKN
jgi:hypothetical protein